MKTTLDISDQLLLAAKQQALDENTSLKNIVERALGQLLERRQLVTRPIRTIMFPATAYLPDQKRSALTPEQLREAAYPGLTVGSLAATFKKSANKRSRQSA